MKGCAKLCKRRPTPRAVYTHVGQYVCKVGDPSGRIFQQVETAQSEGEARQALAEQRLLRFFCRANLDFIARSSPRHEPRSLHPPGRFLIFNQQFNTLVKAGLPILKALDLLAERAASPRLRPILRRRPPASARRRAAFRSLGRAGFVSSGLRDRDRRGRTQRQPYWRPRAVHFVSARQHRLPSRAHYRTDLSRILVVAVIVIDLSGHLRDAAILEVSIKNWAFRSPPSLNSCFPRYVPLRDYFLSSFSHRSSLPGGRFLSGRGPTKAL
jgi:hypothetical protein